MTLSRRGARALLTCAALLTLATSASRGALTPRYDAVLDLLLEGPILSLDPLRARTRAEQDVTGLLFEGLVAGGDGGFRGAAAARWSVSRDSLRWTFRLDPARRFGDGTPLRATDVLAAWSRARRDAPEWGWLFEGWGAAATDSVTIEVTMKNRLPRFAERLSLPGAWVAREVERGGVRSLTGTAPFRFAGRQAEGFLLAPRLDDPRGRPYPGRVVLRLPHAGPEAQGLWTDAEVVVGEAALLERAPAAAVALERGLRSTWVVQINPRRPALGAEARRWLAATLDRERLVAAAPGAGLAARVTWSGAGRPPAPAAAGGPLPPGLRVLCDRTDPIAVALTEELATQFGFSPAPTDPAAARRALRDVSYDLALVRWDPVAAGDLGRIEFSRRPETAALAPEGAATTASALERLEALRSDALLIPLVDRPQRLWRSAALTGLELDPVTGGLRCDAAWPAWRDR